MEQAALDIDLGSIFSLSTVQVVQSIDVAGLQKTLKWICSKLGQQNGEAGNSATAAAVEDLIQQNSILHNEVKELKQQQSRMLQRLDTKADADQLPRKEILEVPGEVAGLAGLQARMDALEAGAAVTGGSDISDVYSRLDAVEQALEELQRSMAAAAAAAAATGSGSPRERSFRAAPPADPPMQGSAAEPCRDTDTAALQQALSDLEQRLDTKANKSSIKDIWGQLQSLQPLQPPQGAGGSSDGLAALSQRVRELEEDRAVGLEALEAAVASLKDAVAGKADAGRVQSIGDRVSALSVEKAEQTGLDELRLKMAMVAAPAAMAAAAEGGPPEAGAATAGSDALVQLIQGMLEEKAGRAEVAQLKEVVDAKAGSEELEALRTQFIMDGAPAVAAVASGGDVGVQGNFALKVDLSRLADQVGDMYAEIEKLRHQLPRGELVALARQQSHKAGAARPASPQQAAAAGAPESRLLSVAVQDSTSMHVLQELQVLKEQVEMVAHATNILTVGLEARSMAGVGGVGDGSAQTPGSPAPTSALSPSSTGKESRLPKGAYARLVKLLGSQGFNQKMDHFDPEVLNRMAQKLAYVDALLKNPSFARGQGAEDLGIRELEAQMRKLSRDVRAMKQAQATGAGPQGEGEHAMLAGKPILGYRCMACDRPIEKLDERAGPHVPTNQMTSKVMLGKPDISRTVLKSPGDTSPQTRKKAAYDPSLRGPQTWYEDQRNIAADGLPAADVGPRLAPGGWRSSASGAPPLGRPNNLPDLPISAPRPASPQLEPQARTPPKSGSSSGSGPVYDLPVLPRI